MSICLKVLLTDQDLMNHHRQSDLVTALNSLLDMRMIPILNGNDAVAIDDSSKNVSFISLLLCLLVGMRLLHSCMRIVSGLFLRRKL